MAAYRTSAAGGGTSGTTDRTAAITPAVGDLLVVFCNASGNTNSAPTCTDNNGSGTYTLIGTALKNASADILSVFVRTSLMANTTSTTVTVATGSNTAAEIVIVALSGMAKTGASAVLQSNKQINQAASTTPAPAFSSAALTTNVTLGAIANTTSPATMTAPANWVERQDVGQSTPSTGLEVVSRDSGFTGTTITWGGTSASAFASFILEMDGSIGGSLSNTLGSLTTSAAGIVALAGAATITLGLVGTLAAGTVEIVGGLTKSLDSVTTISAGTVESAGIFGESSNLLGGLVSDSVGAVSVQGAATPVLGALTSTSAGTVDILGSFATTLDSLTSGAAGAVAVTGECVSVLGSLSNTLVGTVAVVGSSSEVLGSLTVEAGGSVDIRADSTNILGVLTVSSEGSVGALETSGGIEAVLGSCLGTAEGSVAVSGVLIPSLNPLTGVANGTVSILGNSAVTLGILTSTGAGVVAVSGSSSMNLGTVTLSSQALGTVFGTVSNTLSGLLSVSEGTVNIDGTLNKALSSLSLSGTVTIPVTGELLSNLGTLSLAASNLSVIHLISGETRGVSSAVGYLGVIYAFPEEMTKSVNLTSRYSPLVNMNNLEIRKQSMPYVGEKIRLSTVITDITDELVDPDKLMFTCKGTGKGGVLQYTYGIGANIVRISKGNYYIELIHTMADVYNFRWKAIVSGNIGITEGQLEISKLSF